MILQIKNTDLPAGWEDLTQYLPYDAFEANRRDVEGPNKDTAINGDAIRDVISKKLSFPFVTRAISNDTARHLEGLMADTSFFIRTDYFEGSQSAPEQYEVYAEDVKKVYFHCHAGEDLVTLSVPIKEV